MCIWKANGLTEQESSAWTYIIIDKIKKPMGAHLFRLPPPPNLPATSRRGWLHDVYEKKNFNNKFVVLV